MSARTWWKVKYLKFVEAEEKVCAETEEEAWLEVRTKADAAKVLSVEWMDPEEY